MLCGVRGWVAMSGRTRFGRLPFFAPDGEMSRIPCDFHLESRGHWLCAYFRFIAALVTLYADEAPESRWIEDIARRPPSSFVRAYTNFCPTCRRPFGPETSRHVTGFFTLCYLLGITVDFQSGTSYHQRGELQGQYFDRHPHNPLVIGQTMQTRLGQIHHFQNFFTEVKLWKT